MATSLAKAPPQYAFGRLGERLELPAARRRVERIEGVQRFFERLVAYEAKWHPPRADVGVEFAKLLDQWRRETMMTSDAVAILLHPAHLRIIGMGRDALPFIFEDLQAGGGPWPTALESITGDNPVRANHLEDAAQIDLDWLRWGQENGYVGS